MAESKRHRNEVLRTQMVNERSSFDSHWRSVLDFTTPTRARFTLSDNNRGERRNLKIINNTAALASRTLSSGMMAGITSPARPWFKLGVSDSDLMEYGPVKYWLQAVENEMYNQFFRSTLYNTLPLTYTDLGNIGTAAIFMEEDFDTVSRFYSFPAGSFYLANDELNRIRVFMREFRMTVRQVVEKFGRFDMRGNPDWSNITDHVKTLWDRGHYETWIDIVHVVKPNEDFDFNSKLSEHKRYISIYYERGSSSASGKVNYMTSSKEWDKMLSERGYNHFPILAPRWEVTGEDVYATNCPGMMAHGDNKALQTMEKRRAQAVEKKVNPPMTAPTMMRNSKASILPGDITYADIREGQQGFRPAHEVNFQLQELDQAIQNHEYRIKRSYFEDLFLMISQSDRREITAREIDERHEEKLLVLGPVLEGLNQDLLDPLIDNQFAFGFEQGRFPPPPPELEGVDLKVEYVSVMAQAQKLTGISNIERTVGFAINISTQTQNPELLDKIDFDQVIDNYGKRMGVDVDIIRTDERVDERRQQRQQAIQQQQTMENLRTGSEISKNLSKSDLEKDNVLKRLAEAGA